MDPTKVVLHEGTKEIVLVDDDGVEIATIVMMGNSDGEWFNVDVIPTSAVEVTRTLRFDLRDDDGELMGKMEAPDGPAWRPEFFTRGAHMTAVEMVRGNFASKRIVEHEEDKAAKPKDA